MKKILFLLFTLYAAGIVAQGTCSQTTYSGNATNYIAGNSVGACQLDSSELGPYFCAMNSVQYDSASFCGACLEITGTAGTQIAAVWDMCPSCASGDLDLNPATFQAVVGNLSIGIGSISWKVVSCPWSSQNLWLTNQNGNPWYACFLVHNATNEISSVEVYHNSNWETLTRRMDNAWICSTCTLSGDSALDVRITDIFGQQITVPQANMYGSNTPQYASSNFSPCVNAGIKKVTENDGVKIYEKNNLLYISSPKTFNKIGIYESSGRLVSTAITGKVLTEKINVIELREGMYFAMIYCTDGSVEKARFLKVQH